MCLLAACLMVVQAPLYRVDRRLEPDWSLLDRSVYRSAPGSLRLNAASYDGYRCLPASPARPGTRYRLTFHYLVAAGSDGRFVVRVNDYEGGRLEWSLTAVGRWKRADIDFTTGPRVTSAAVVFEVDSPTNVYEAWVDDVVFRPVGEPVLVGP